MSTNAQRQARLAARRRELGLVPATVWVPANAVADLREMAAAMCDAPHLLPGPLRDPETGKLVSWRA